MVTAVAVAIPALLIGSSGIRAEEHASRFQRCKKRGQNSREMGTRHMEEGGVGKHAIKVLGWQIQLQKVLVQHLAAGVFPGHLTELLTAIEAHWGVTSHFELGQIATRTTAEIKDRVGARAIEGPQKGVDVLGHVVIASALPEIVCSTGIAGEGGPGQMCPVIHGGEVSRPLDCCCRRSPFSQAPAGVGRTDGTLGETEGWRRTREGLGQALSRSEFA